MGDFDAMTNAQLREECTRRGLPVSGTNPELIARLEEYDADDLLRGETEAEPVAGTNAVDPPPVGDAPRQPSASTFKARYECPGELSTGVHLDNLRRVWQDAVAAGHVPRGGPNGAFGATRTGFEIDGGRRYAVYEINIRRS